MLDTLATSRALTEAGFDARQAEAITTAVKQAADQSNHVTPEHLDAALDKLRAAFVTPEHLDLALETLRREMAELRGEFVTREHLDLALDKLRAEFRAELGEFRAEFRGEVGELRGEIARSELRIIRWMVGSALAAVGLSISLMLAFLRLME